MQHATGLGKKFFIHPQRAFGADRRKILDFDDFFVKFAFFYHEASPKSLKNDISV